MRTALTTASSASRPSPRSPRSWRPATSPTTAGPARTRSCSCSRRSAAWRRPSRSSTREAWQRSGASGRSPTTKA
eukprot:12155056-Alexandrium_andersonii.AAC.1